jgi:hypothetical protein
LFTVPLHGPQPVRPYAEPVRGIVRQHVIVDVARVPPPPAGLSLPHPGGALGEHGRQEQARPFFLQDVGVHVVVAGDHESVRAVDGPPVLGGGGVRGGRHRGDPAVADQDRHHGAFAAVDQTVPFGLNGVTYAVDLSATNAKMLCAALQPYVTVARRTGGRRIKFAVGQSADNGWAQEKGAK